MYPVQEPGVPFPKAQIHTINSGLHEYLQGESRVRPRKGQNGRCVRALQAQVEEGLSGLYAGISAAWLRQATFGTMRHGLYGRLTEDPSALSREEPGHEYASVRCESLVCDCLHRWRFP